MKSVPVTPSLRILTPERTAARGKIRCSSFAEEALGQNNWNQTRTAEVLGLPRQGVIKKLQRYGIRGKGGE